jgi:hypothetical protein
MSGQSVEQLTLGLIRSQISDKSAFGRVFAQFLEMRSIVCHRDAMPPGANSSLI